MNNKHPLFEINVVAASKLANYHYPASMVLLPDGRLMVLYSRGFFINKNKEPLYHVSNMVSYSCDGGKSWGRPHVLFMEGIPTDGQDISGHGFCDGCIVVFPDRLVVYAQSFILPNDLSATYSWFRESFNWGKTWSPIKKADYNYGHKYVAGLVQAGVLLRDGSVIRGMAWEEKADAGYRPNGEGEQKYHVTTLRSMDNGKTWDKGADVFADIGQDTKISWAIQGLDEPVLTELDDGSLYMLMRSGADKLYETRSHDFGKTWDPAVPSGLTACNCPAELLRLSTGEILVVHNDNPLKRTHLCVRLSIDGCKTWSKPKHFAPEGNLAQPEASYPVATQLPDGTIVVAWCQRRNDIAKDLFKVYSARFNKEWLLST